MFKTIFAVAIIATLFGCEPVQAPSEEETTAMIHRITDKYQVPRPDVYYFPFQYLYQNENTLAQMECSPIKKECLIKIRPCALRAREYKEAITHEALHVVNFHINGKYDHGIEWKRLMAREGYRNAKTLIHNTTCS